MTNRQPVPGQRYGLLLSLLMVGGAVPGGLGTSTIHAAASGMVEAWGENSSGQTTVPAGLTDVIAISAGSFHSLALKSDGRVVAWGENFDGGSTVPAAAMSEVTAIAAGRYHSVALKSDGTVVAWGSNNDQTDTHFAGQSIVPIGLKGVTAIAAGAFHTVALKDDGTVVAWGLNDPASDDFGGQTRVPDDLRGVTAVAAGRLHTVALKSDGRVVAWGGNSDNQLEVPPGLSGVAAVSVSPTGYHSLALKNDGTVVAWGSNDHGQTTVPAGLNGVMAISAGGYHSVAMLSNGKLVAWGRNGDGQSTVPAGLLASAVAAGGYFNLAIVAGPDPATSSFPESKAPAAVSATTGIQVTLSPGNGQWRLSWEPYWRNAGTAAAGLPPGDYEIAFKPLPGLANPTNLPVRVRAGFIDPFHYTYPASVATGQLLVQLRANTDPDRPLMVAGSGWQLDGDGVVRSDGQSLNIVPAGRHLVSFLPAVGTGWSTPETVQVEVIPGQTAVITGYYLPAGDCLPVDVSGPARVSLPVLDSATTNPQLSVVGQLRSAAGFGSGIAVRERVVLTAAHVVFDDVQLAPVPQVEWRGGRMRLDGNASPDREPQPLLPRGVYLLSSYAAQRTNDIQVNGQLPGTVTADSARHDAAALWFTGPAARGGFAGYLVKNAGDPFIGTRIMLAGYPIVGGVGCPPSPGALHKTEVVMSSPNTTDPRVYTFDNFRSFPGNSGGPVFAADADDKFFPAGIYLGDGSVGGGIVSRVRVIDTNVLAIVNLAVASGNTGTNFTGGGVGSAFPTRIGAKSFQRLTVNFSPPGVAALARWKLLGQTDASLRGHASNQQVIAPTNLVVTFTGVSGFVTPADLAVAIQPGQDAIVEVAYTPSVSVPPVLSVESNNALRVSGPAGLMIHLQFRAALGVGSWADVPGKSFLLGGAPVTVRSLAEGTATPGFYRVVVVP